MSVKFSGWRVNDSEHFFHHGELKPLQKPHKQGIYTMYHGTSVANARLIIANGFKQSEDGLLGKGVYVTRDIIKACLYPKKSKYSDRVVLKLSVRLGRVKRICKDKDPMQTTWSHRYHSAWVPPDCGMKAVPSGLQENCVFDPNRVKVVGIARAPTNTIERELLVLLEDNHMEDHGDRNLCLLCRRKAYQEIPHIPQQCWNCDKNICILMIEHKCQAKPWEESFFEVFIKESPTGLNGLLSCLLSSYLSFEMCCTNHMVKTKILYCYITFYIHV